MAQTPLGERIGPAPSIVRLGEECYPRRILWADVPAAVDHGRAALRGLEKLLHLFRYSARVDLPEQPRATMVREIVETVKARLRSGPPRFDFGEGEE